MTEKDKVIINYDEKGKAISVIDNRYYGTEITSIEELVNIINEQDQTIEMWCKSSRKIIKLLEENTKPTAYDRGDVYLDIGDDKRCKYEDTVICYKCGYFSSYFLDCRLMMEDNQYKKALYLGLVKENDSDD